MNRKIKNSILKIKNFHYMEKKIKILKYLSERLHINNNLRKKIFFKIFCLKKFSITLIRRHCVISGRSRGILKNLKISRIFLKSLINDGLFNGQKK